MINRMFKMNICYILIYQREKEREERRMGLTGYNRKDHEFADNNKNFLN